MWPEICCWCARKLRIRKERYVCADCEKDWGPAGN